MRMRACAYANIRDGGGRSSALATQTGARSGPGVGGLGGRAPYPARPTPLHSYPVARPGLRYAAMAATSIRLARPADSSADSLHSSAAVRSPMAAMGPRNRIPPTLWPMLPPPCPLQCSRPVPAAAGAAAELPRSLPRRSPLLSWSARGVLEIRNSRSYRNACLLSSSAHPPHASLAAPRSRSAPPARPPCTRRRAAP